MVVYVLSYLSANDQSKKKYMDLCQHANKCKPVVLEALFLIFMVFGE